MLEIRLIILPLGHSNRANFNIDCSRVSRKYSIFVAINKFYLITIFLSIMRYTILQEFLQNTDLGGIIGG